MPSQLPEVPEGGQGHIPVGSEGDGRGGVGKGVEFFYMHRVGRVKVEHQVEFVKRTGRSCRSMG